MPGDDKQRLIEIVDHLPPRRVVQLIEFAEHLKAEEQTADESSRQAIDEVFGKYKDLLSSSDEHSKRKREERELEER